MKTKPFFSAMLCLILFSSCSEYLVVWNAKDIIGLIILALVLIVFAILRFLER